MTDHQQPDVQLERSLLATHGIRLVAAQCSTPQEIIDAADDAQAIYVQFAPMTREVIDALSELRLITINAAGYDNIDVAAARRRGIWVCNVPHASINEVATHALAMALALIRHLPRLHESVRGGSWDPTATGPLRRPSAMRLGVLGLGAIGRQLVRLASPCFNEIVAHDPYLEPKDRLQGVRLLGLEALFETSDVVSIHVPLRPETYRLVGRDLLSRLRRGGYLINVSRGEVVDCDALLESLDTGQIGGAALDVLPQEPPDPNDPVIRHPRVWLSPHAAYYSVESEEELRRTAIENILTWHRTGTPSNVVVEGTNVQ